MSTARTAPRERVRHERRGPVVVVTMDLRAKKKAGA
jgi:hypothetical protein